MTTDTTSTNDLHVIVGAGPVGKGIARELAAKGRRVRIINRSGKAADLPASVEIVAGDAYNPDSARELTRGAAVIYQAAQPEYHEWVVKFPPLQTNILNAAIANQSKLVVVENLYMYSDPKGAPLTARLPYQPHTRKGRVRAAMAQELHDAAKAGKARVTSGRASDFYGPEYEVMADQLFYPALEGRKASGLGSLDLPHSFTFIPDFAKALVILGERPEADGRAWHVPSAPPITQRELITMTFEAAGQPVKMGSIGKLMMRIGGLFMPGARETVEMMYEWEQPWVMDSSAFVRAFGDHATPHRQAIAQTVDYFRAHPRAK
jgi:nucleoside-diphosphate-sugar epimerase